MSKLTLDDLRKLREQTRKEISLRETGAKDVLITVGMGTCGIAAGAKDTFGAIVDALAAQGLTNVLVRQTGCMGLCHSEPTVEVLVPGMPTVIYGRVTPELGRQIVKEHLVGRHLIDNHICDKPAADIVG